MFKYINLLLIASLQLVFAVQSADYISHQIRQNQLRLQTNEGQVEISALHSHAFETLYIPKHQSPFPSFAKDPQPRAHQPNLSLIDNPHQLTLTNGQLTAVINKSPLRITYFDHGRLLIAEEAGFFNHRTVQGFRFKLQQQEQLLGTGERVIGMNRRGQRLPLYNRAHYSYSDNAKELNFSIPAVMSTNKYILLFDNSASGWLDLGKSQPDILQFEANGGRHSYIIIAADNYPQLIHHYVDVTGKQPLPPRWALGNHGSRFGYKTQQQVLTTAAKYQQADIPLDSMIIDLYWFGPDIKGHMGKLEWDLNAFPKPQQMIQTLKDQGVNTVLITEPFILTNTPKWSEAVESGVFATGLAGKKPLTYDFYFGHTGLIDVFERKAQQWFGQVYQQLAKQGVAGVWGDLGEPEVHPANMLHTLSAHNNLKATADEVHNAYGHQWAKLVNQALSNATPSQRQFIIMRAGFAGSQRYGMIPWTGDVARSWQGLAAQVELSLQMSLLAMAYTHSDLGGFAGGESFDQQLYVRWLQYGVFQPIYRPHGHDAIAPEPVFHDPQTLSIVRDYIRLRYRLLPYLYTMAYHNSTTGMPLMRPMFFEDENNPELIEIKDQYLWGNDFLVKPVTEAHIDSIKVRLPKGNWIDFWTDKVYQGDQIIDYPLTLQTLPVLVRAGAIIPTIEPVNSTKHYSSKRLNLNYYFDNEIKNSSAQMYEDDGKDPKALARKQYELLQFDAQFNDQLNFNLARQLPAQGYPSMPQQRRINLTIHHWPQAPKSVSINDQTVQAFEAVESLEQPTQGYYFDPVNKRLSFQLDWQHQSTTIAIKP